MKNAIFKQDHRQWDVIVVGLGPVGTTLCGLLARQGLSVLGVEREASIYTLPRAGHMDHSVLRTLEEIGALDAVLADMIPNNGLELRGRGATVLARLPVAPRTPSGLPASMHFHQPSFDRIVRATVETLAGVSLHNATRMETFTQDAEGVTATLVSGEERQTVRARFLIGCDGAGSPTRAQAGIAMRDYGFAESWVVVDLILREIPADLPKDTVFGADPDRPYAAIELPGMRYRFEFMLMPGETPADVTSPEAVYKLISPWVQPKHVQAIERAIVYTFRGAQAETWRQGRIALAGDAAHLTPPFLGQGLCSGVRDAANLAWKVAGFLQGRLPEAILDSYQAERGPHIDNVITVSIDLAKHLCQIDPEIAAARDHEMLNSGLAETERLRFKLGELQAGHWIMDNGGMYMVGGRDERGTLDMRTGNGFTVIARDQGALEDPNDLVTRLSAKVLLLDELGQPEVTAFMERRGFKVVLVRPDRYVLGGGDKLAEISDFLKPVLG